MKINTETKQALLCVLVLLCAIVGTIYAADNITLNAGTGGPSLAADDIAGVHYQRFKLIFGPDGTNEGDVSSTNQLPVQGQAAHDAAIDGQPNRIAARALTANYTAVATGDTADLVSTVTGSLIQKPYSIPEGDWSYAAANLGIVNTTTAVTFKTAAGAGIRNYITAIQFSSEALGTATELAIRDGAGGTVIWRTKIGTAGLINGREIVFPSPLKSTANTLLEVVTLTASGTGAVYFNAQGYAAP